MGSDGDAHLRLKGRRGRGRGEWGTEQGGCVASWWALCIELQRFYYVITQPFHFTPIESLKCNVK